MKIRKVLVSRVFNIGDFQNRRLGLEIEIEDGDNENLVIINAINFLLDLNDFLQEWSSLRSEWRDLLEYIKKRDPFTVWADHYIKKLGQKQRTLECLEDFGKIPTTCQDLGSIRVDQIESRKEELKREISELNKKLDQLDNLQQVFNSLRSTYDKATREILDLAKVRRFKDARKRASDMINEINKFRRKLEDLKPSYW